MVIKGLLATWAHHVNYSYYTTKSNDAQRALYDIRDNETYTVRKLADGNCWMTENLNISGITVSSTNTNLPEGASYTIPNSSADNWCIDDTEECANTQNILLANVTVPGYGTYYSWRTATAGYGSYSTDGTIEYSICPKGWRLPDGGSNNEFSGLVNAGYNTSEKMRSGVGPSFTLAGSHWNTSNYFQGSRGYYWSNRAYTSQHYALFLYIDEDTFTTGDGTSLFLGYSVRCVSS